MTALAIDTLQLVKDLKLAGFDEPQAEAVTRAIRQSQDVDLAHMATRADLAALVTRGDLREELTNFATKADLMEAKSELKTEISELRSEIAVGKWVNGAALAAIMAIFAKLFLGV
jgi:hypothetical protein